MLLHGTVGVHGYFYLLCVLAFGPFRLPHNHVPVAQGPEGWSYMHECGLQVMGSKKVVIDMQT
jgi:hypothetical protein